MDQQKQTEREQSGPSKQVARGDRHSAAVVRKGITLQQIHGTHYAAEFLKEKEIDIEVIMRVLQNMSDQRRHDDFIEVAERDAADTSTPA